MLFVAAGSWPAGAQTAAPNPSSERNYIAYRTTQPTTSEARRQAVEAAAAAGLSPVVDGALDRAGLLVFRADNPALVEKGNDLFAGLLRVPIREYRGLLSVYAGNFYLRFQDEVSAGVARKRVEALGFKVLTPSTDTGRLLVVQGTGLPGERERELARLKELQQLLYVAPNDIALKVPKSTSK